MTAGPPHPVEALMDFHLHSQYSNDGRGTLQDFIQRAYRKGIQGFAVTDHNDTRMWEHIRRETPKDLVIVPGMEVSTADGHCLAIGVQAPVPRDRSLEETLEFIRDANGVGVPSHPYRWTHGVGEKVLRRALPKLVALEVFNASDGDGGANPRSDHFAVHHGLGGTGGSDGHRIVELGNGYTMFPDFPETVDDVVEQVRKGRTWGGGTATPLGDFVRQKARNVWLFARRGFRSI